MLCGSFKEKFTNLFLFASYSQVHRIDSSIAMTGGSPHLITIVLTYIAYLLAGYADPRAPRPNFYIKSEFQNTERSTATCGSS